jgi:Amt family ammonium transporter
LLLATADGSGADTVARWTLVLAWAVVVFPAAVIVPPLISTRCTALECSIEDFGGALALLISSGSLVLLAWLPAGLAPGRELDRGTWRSVGGPVLLLWLGFAIWLIHLEGAIDAYVPRILMAAVLAPVAGALSWLLVDVLRASGQHPGRSLTFGLVAGMVAILPGAVTVSFPWSLVVGGLAGAVGALVHGARSVAAAGVATRWAVTILVATAIGYFAPPISGDTVGLLFSPRLLGIVPPTLAFAAVVAFSLIASAPLWILLRRHASRARR